jgi:hypothetical protein
MTPAAFPSVALPASSTSVAAAATATADAFDGRAARGVLLRIHSTQGTIHIGAPAELVPDPQCVGNAVQRYLAGVEK